MCGGVCVGVTVGVSGGREGVVHVWRSMHMWYDVAFGSCWGLGVRLLFSPTVAKALASINECIEEEAGDPAQTLLALKSEFSELGSLVDESCVQRYHDALKSAREEKGEVSSTLQVK